MTHTTNRFPSRLMRFFVGACLSALLIGGVGGVSGTRAQTPDPPTDIPLEDPSPTPTAQQPSPITERSISIWDSKLEVIDKIDEAEISTRPLIDKWAQPAQPGQVAAAAPVFVAPQPAVTPPPRGDGFLYTVQRGDSLSTIASQYNVSVFALVQANALPNPNLIRVGQSLWVPAAGAGVAAPVTGGTGSPPTACPDAATSYAATIGAWLDEAGGAVGPLRAALTRCGIYGDVWQPGSGDALPHVVVVLHGAAVASDVRAGDQIVVYGQQATRACLADEYGYGGVGATSGG